VRNLSGFQEPSKVNAAAFDRAVLQISEAARELVNSLVTSTPSKNRDDEAQKTRAPSLQRFG